ncbi:MAG: aldo/keto reductase [Candidatus Sumerlaeota bacterium]|nr:aldo/keto reductase [Candidatus Sumerlaeota bacterium]
MKFRVLGKTGWRVSAVSMGAWAIGGQWGEVGAKQGVETIHAALDAGVNLIDTADAYGTGVSETYIGKALQGRRDRAHLATKVGHWGDRQGDSLQYKSVHSIYQCCHASLFRLATDYIDIYQCHLSKPERPELFVEAFEQLKKEGKIRQYAISTDDVEALKAINVNGQCATCQINYSILNRVAENAILPYCQQANIGVLLRGPLAQGILADKFTADTVFEDSVRASWNSGKNREKLLARLKLAERLRPLVRDGRSMVDLALQFTLAHPAVTCPIPGMKSPAQARQNALAADGELTPEELRAIDAVCPPGKAS